MRIAALLLSALALTAAHAQDKKDDPKPAPGKFPEFTGRVEAEVTEIRPRVSGYLTAIHVKEGQDVQKGQVLAEIDPRVFRIEADKARAKMVRAEVQAKAADGRFERVKGLLAKGIVPKDEVDVAEAEREASRAEVDFAKAELHLAELHLSWTKITAPIDGRIGRLHQSLGNIVRADTDTLTSIVRPDPLRVTFDVDERTVLRLRDAIADGRVKDGKLAAAVAFADEEDFPHRLTVDFLDTAIDAKTGTLRVGAKLPNPKGTVYPGTSVRVRLTLAK
jgi:RND family efflux transporter MFP subunit